MHLFEELEPFRCIKVETVPAGTKYTAILEATAGRLNVSGGWAVPQLIEALDRGIHAVMPGGLHWPLVAIIRRYRDGDRVGASALFDRLLPILAWQNQHIDISNQFLKLLAVRQGIFATAALRDPQVPYDAYHYRIAEELIDDSMALHAEHRLATRMKAIRWHARGDVRLDDVPVPTIGMPGRPDPHRGGRHLWHRHRRGTSRPNDRAGRTASRERPRRHP